MDKKIIVNEFDDIPEERIDKDSEIANDPNFIEACKKRDKVILGEMSYDEAFPDLGTKTA